ncbi:hypothetical protein PMI27_000669 [Pseudomonas sp. GM41(2012)]|jgi:hypothetical protein|uniref:hypothetical protein n=1 Tax=Pseudomonas sp. (strain GM41(2012)) TaxID=1144708 RepID=UPI00026FD6CA|nr:hypothetical protein [Pseudomonas sp. GM41(2012)]EUB74493.1 hypothetical protein PMI27_000669 [Pseudomonas sp. GM41(2012)]
MATFIVTAARHTEGGKLIALQGQETHGHVANTLPGESSEHRDFSVPEVLGLIERGDAFYLAFGPFDSRVNGGLIIPDGKGSLSEGEGRQGRCIADLPSF